MSGGSQADSPADPETAWTAARRRIIAGEEPIKVAADLVSQMTLDERLGCLDGDTDFWPGIADIRSGGYHRHPWPAAAVARLGVPGLNFSDGPRGVVIGKATCFPVSMARGATWDPALEERVGDAIGRELKAVGATLYGGVCINLLRHPGWGRAQETYGEDPLLVGEMGAALARGVQRHAMACVKHFALNSMENSRYSVDVTADDRTLHEVYLPHFRRVVAEGVASVMTAYNSVNGHWCGENRPLIEDVLRRAWGFDGFVISDFMFGLRDPVKSVEAGLDIEMPFRQQRLDAVPEALAEGTLDPDHVDAAVGRLIATLLRFSDRLGEPSSDPDVLACAEHRHLARQVAQRSITLLRNEPVNSARPVLPLDPESITRLAVLGRLADEANLGDHGSSRVFPPTIATVLAGLREALPGANVLTPSDFSANAAVALADTCDVAIVVVGLTHEDEGEYVDPSTQHRLSHLLPPRPDDWPAIPASDALEGSFGRGGDRRSPELHDDDRLLIAATARSCPQTVVVLIGGSAILVDPWYEQVPAIVQAWYPGMQGGDALADVLTGKAEPGGRLPFAIPTDPAHLASFDTDHSTPAATYDMWHGQWKLDRDRRAARYPFGFGLSYGTSEVTRASCHLDGQTITVNAQLHGDGPRPAPEVLQIYLQGPPGGSERPARKLVGFSRVTAPPGAAVNETLQIPLARLAVRVDGAWKVEQGKYRFHCALNAADPGISCALELDATILPGKLPAGEL